jgi:hypothetical protein
MWLVKLRVIFLIFDWFIKEQKSLNKKSVDSKSAGFVSGSSSDSTCGGGGSSGRNSSSNPISLRTTILVDNSEDRNTIRATQENIRN